MITSLLGVMALCVWRGGAVSRTSDPQSGDFYLGSCAAVSVTSVCSLSIAQVHSTNGYLAMHTGGYLWTNCLRDLIAALRNTSQTSR